MPWRDLNRDQGWLMPPSLSELLGADHPARVVAAFVDALSREEWTGLGVELEARKRGVPAYHPRALLGVWIYGFMTGVRSSRKLEEACRESLPYIWLTGGQQPDHNTLWRFYQSHRDAMRNLLRKTVQTAVKLDLVDWALQAVDGTKIAGTAANKWTFTQSQLRRLERKTDEVIAELERSHERDHAPPRTRLSGDLRDARQLIERVKQARRDLEESGQRFISLVDVDARLMKRARGGSVTGYNAQAVAARLRSKSDVEEPAAEDPRPYGGIMLLAAEVSQKQVDFGELPQMVDAAAETGTRADVTVADAGYFSAATLGALKERGITIVMPETKPVSDHPYHWRHFDYDAQRDRYICPEGAELKPRQRRMGRGTPARMYAADGETCQACPAFGDCTTSKLGRTITVSEQAEALEEHRRWMSTDRAQEAMHRRAGLIEPVFGIIKERQAGRRFLLRGIEPVRAEWSLLAIAFNLRALSKHWKPVLTMLEEARTMPLAILRD